MAWGIQPTNITTDSWYSSRKNLKFFRDKGLSFLVGIAKNRLVKLEGGKSVRVETLDIPPEGMVVTLKQFGVIKVFKRTFKNGRTRYLIWFQLDESTKSASDSARFEEVILNSLGDRNLSSSFKATL